MFANLLKLLASTVLCLVAVTHFAYAGAGDSRGGGETDKNNKRALSQLLEGNAYYLKAAMLNYLETLVVEKIPDVTETDLATKTFFSRIGKEKFKADLQESKYVTASGCQEKYAPAVTAQTD